MPAPLPGPGETALAWLQRAIAMPTTLHDAGTWAAPGGVLYPTDPLGLWQNFKEPGLTVPVTPARVVGLMETSQKRTALLALIWSDAPIVGGTDLWTIASITGLAGFLTPQDVDAVHAYGEPEKTPYHGTYREQLGAIVPTLPFIARLPAGNAFPVSGSGWGNSGYPVASLTDANGAMCALYAHFIGGGDDWLLPPGPAALP